VNQPPPHPSSPLPLPALPSPRDPAIQAALDASHLQLLEIGFYISGILTALRFLWFLAIVILFSVAGLGATFAGRPGSTGSPNAPPPAVVFFIIAGVFGVIIVFSLIFACLEIYAGMCLKKRQHPILIQIVAAFYCLSIPWGTALGVFTFMVLNRPSVKSLFNQP